MARKDCVVRMICWLLLPELNCSACVASGKNPKQGAELVTHSTNTFTMCDRMAVHIQNAQYAAKLRLNLQNRWGSSWDGLIKSISSKTLAQLLNLINENGFNPRKEVDGDIFCLL